MENGNSASAKKLSITVVGWEGCPNFQRAKSGTEDLAKTNPALYQVKYVTLPNLKAYETWLAEEKPKLGLTKNGPAHENSPLIYFGDNDYIGTYGSMQLELAERKRKVKKEEEKEVVVNVNDSTIVNKGVNVNDSNTVDNGEDVNNTNTDNGEDVNNTNTDAKEMEKLKRWESSDEGIHTDKVPGKATDAEVLDTVAAIQPLLADKKIAPEKVGHGRHDKMTVDKKTRMKLNGETKEMMEHAKNLKARQGDTSVDWPFEIDESLRGRDNCVLFVTGLYLGPKTIALYVPLCLLMCFPVCIMWIYTKCIKKDDFHEQIPRTPGVRVLLSFLVLLSSPIIAIVFVLRVFDWIFIHSISLVFCLCLCRWKRAMKGWEVVKPYRNGPSVMFNPVEVLICLLGHIRRHGPFKVISMHVCMYLWVPWMKYFINCNPWIYDVQERLVQQISTTMADMSLEEVDRAARMIISRSQPTEEQAWREYAWDFVPHYPYPPEHKRWAVGMQTGANYFTLFVHTTHAYSEHGGSTEQFVLSNSCAKPIYRVMLWYNNPYHFFTGWVEASISTGLPSQPDKLYGGEHPMWLVSGNSPLTAARNSWTGSGFIDRFFDEWLPSIVDEIRLINRGKAIADKLHQEVETADIASHPKSLKGHTRLVKGGLGRNEKRVGKSVFREGIV